MPTSEWIFGMMESANSTERQEVIDVLFGEGSGKDNIGTSIHGTSFEAEDGEPEIELVKTSVSNLEAATYVIEWFIQVKDATGDMTGKLRHNQVEKGSFSVNDSGETYTVFKGLEYFSFLDSGRQDIELDLRYANNDIAKVCRSVVNVYKYY